MTISINMKTLLNHLFYRAYWWQETILKETDAILYKTTLITSVFLIFNFFAAIFAFSLYYLKNPVAYPSSAHLIAALAIVFLVYLIYIPSNNYIKIIDECKREDKKIINKRDIMLIIYIVITMATLLYIVIQGREYMVSISPRMP
jgi:hypothetical protein